MTDETKTIKCKVLSAFSHKGTAYRVDDEIELDEETANEYATHGWVEVPTAASEPAATETGETPATETTETPPA